MTEDEAKTKWCPFARTGLNGNAGAVAVNRFVDLSGGPYDVQAQTRCLGSACMAYQQKSRAAQEEVLNRKTMPEGDGWQPLFDGNDNKAWFRPWQTGPDGFCGLAGQP